MNQNIRFEMLIGPEGLERLRRARVAVFGLGGVGGYVVEALPLPRLPESVRVGRVL